MSNLDLLARAANLEKPWFVSTERQLEIMVDLAGHTYSYRRRSRIGVKIQKLRRALWLATHDPKDPYLVPPPKTWMTRNDRRRPDYRERFLFV